MNNNEEFLKRFKVLLVDEDVERLEILAILLQECQVIKCKGGEEAMLKLHENKDAYNMVITAARMVNMDGFQLLHQIQDMDLPIPVAFFSNKDETKDLIKDAIIEQGACDFITNPDNINMPKLVWQQVLENKSSSEKSVHTKKQSIPEAQDQQRRCKLEAEEEGEGRNLNTSQRFVWTPTLKEIFTMVIDRLGGCTNAVPKKIHEYMRQNHNVPSTINRQHISSYLQKYRKKCEKHKECIASRQCIVPIHSHPSPNTNLGADAFHPLTTYATNDAPRFSQQHPMQDLNPKLSIDLKRNNLGDMQPPLPHLPQLGHEVVNGGLIGVNHSVMNCQNQGTIGIHVSNHVQSSRTGSMPQQQPTFTRFASCSINTSTSASHNNSISSFELPLENDASIFSPIPTLGLSSHNVTIPDGLDPMTQNNFATIRESFKLRNCYDSVIPQDTRLQHLSVPSLDGNFHQENNISNMENGNNIRDAEAELMMKRFWFDDGDLQ